MIKTETKEIIINIETFAHLPLELRNSAKISSKVLFFVSGTFLYVNIQKIARNTLKGRNV